MRYNKFKAFTLAEVMILLLTLSILMAAFAPVFTRRYENVNSDEVWTYIPGDNNYNAYFDSPNRIFINSAFVGLTPKDSEDVVTLSKNDSGKVVYSKLIIAASKKLGPTFLNTPPQQQMQFRYGSGSAQGSLVGSLFAGNGNMLVGGPYKDITNEAVNNTAFGLRTMEKLVSGSGNTAVGAFALNALKEGHFNTAIGYGAGATLSKGSANTVVGTYAGYQMSSSADENTLVGYEAGKTLKGNANTAVGFQALMGEAGDGNTAVGAHALKNATGKYNTALGSSALINMEKGNFNTAVGASSCMFIGKDGRELSKITCVGQMSASESYATLPSGSGEGNSNVPDRVFIGSKPVNQGSDIVASKDNNPFAVLEVHNSINDPQNIRPVPAGEESVIINGNLIVRGLTYLEMPIFRAAQAVNFPKNVASDDPALAPKGLVLYRLVKIHKGPYVFAGFDGSDRDSRSYSSCHGCRQRLFDDVRPNCICTSVGPGHYGHTHFVPTNKNTRYASTSYDWTSKATNQNGTNPKEGCGSGILTTSYEDLSTCTAVKLSRQPGGYNQDYNSKSKKFAERETDKPYAHLPYHSETGGFECCPNLRSAAGQNVKCKTTSSGTTAPATGGGGGGGGGGGYIYDDHDTHRNDKDHLKHHADRYVHFHSSTRSDIRLKDVGEKFTAGLEEVKKLRPYHFTFKNDVNKIPQVGVMAQDLKAIFPTAVDKGADGYYRIRWQEMFYAAINAVKTLNSKVESLASKVATDKDRIAALKRDNAAMYAQLDKLADELEDLEAKKK